MLCAKRYILSHSKLTTVTRDYFYNYPQGHTVNGVKFELSQEILEPLLITATLKNIQKKSCLFLMILLHQTSHILPVRLPLQVSEPGVGAGNDSPVCSWQGHLKERCTTILGCTTLSIHISPLQHAWALSLAARLH